MTEFLSEAWKKGYETFLENEDQKINNDLDSLFEELNQAQEETKRSLNILQEYYNIIATVDTALLEDETGHNGKEAGTAKEVNVVNNFGSGKYDENKNKIPGVFSDLFSILSSENDRGNKSVDYAPTALFTTKSVREMKFPENIIFFIGQLIKWIKNVILYFIAKFINLIRRLTLSSEQQIPVKFPALDFKKVKKVEGGMQTVTLTDNPETVKLININSDNLSVFRKALSEGYVLTEGLGIFDDIIDSEELKKRESDKKLTQKSAYIVSLNFSKDLDDLRLLVQHFYDLFDKAYGSNNEKLFDTQDLSIILELIKSQLLRIKNGGAATTFTLGSSAAEIDAVNINRVKDNLILTNSNITSLKQAYVETSQKIKNIANIINRKEMLALSQYGVEYKVLTQSTMNAMKSILDTIPQRVKQAKHMEVRLIKMKKAYEKVIKELESAERAMISVGSVTFTAPYQKQVSDLLNSTRFMSNIITLRLSGLGLFIKELQDVRDLMKMLAGINGK